MCYNFCAIFIKAAKKCKMIEGNKKNIRKFKVGKTANKSTRVC